MSATLLVPFIALVLFVIYILLNDAKLTRTPPEALAISPERWTPEEVKQQHAAMVDGPASLFEGKLPPKTGRRYIVIGGVSVPRAVV